MGPADPAMNSVLFISHYLPPAYKAGGPISVVRTLLGDDTVAHQITFLGSWEDLGGQKLAADDVVQHDQGYPTIHRCKTAKELVIFLVKHRRDLRVIYVNSLFDPVYAILPLIIGVLMGKPVCISPRGELHPPALAIKSGKKSVWLAALRLMTRFQKFNWIVTNPEEESYIHARQLAKNAIIHVLNDPIPFIPEHPRTPRLPGETPVVLTCGRIAPIKNHLFVLDCLKKHNQPVVWQVTGTIEDQALFDHLKARTDDSDIITFKYNGACPYQDVMAQMRSADLLFNPSLSENFGYVFIEALACGLPVLASNGTPWSGLAEAGVGGTFDLNDQGAFLSTLGTFLVLDHDGNRAHKCREFYAEVAQNYSPQSLLELLKIIGQQT